MSGVVRRLAATVPIAVALGMSGCDLKEVTIPNGEPVVVVQAVMRPDRQQQYVLLEQAFNGVVNPIDQNQPVPPSGLDTPLDSAEVVVVNLDRPNDPVCGDTVMFDRGPGGSFSLRTPGVYWSPVGCPVLRAGDRLVLSIRTPQAEIVTATARVPAVQGGTLRLGETLVRLDGDTSLFNRDHDTLGIAVDAEGFRGIQLYVLRTGTGPPRLESPPLSQAVDPPPRPTLSTFLDTAAVEIPGSVRDVFESGTGDATFWGGRRYTVLVGVLDTNYFDFLRSQNNAITGRGFLNRVSGGIGVFGVLWPLIRVLNVHADLDDPREGTYRLEGVIGGAEVAVDVTAYLHEAPDGTAVSAFLSGQWVINAGGSWQPDSVTGQSVDGTFSGDSLQLVVSTVQMSAPPINRVEGLRAVILSGVRNPGSPFAVHAEEPLSTGGTREVGVLVATHR